MSNNEMMNLADRLKVLRDEKADMQAQIKDIQTDIDKTASGCLFLRRERVE